MVSPHDPAPDAPDDGLFVTSSALGPFFVSAEPLEYGFLATAPLTDLVRVAEATTGVSSETRLIEDYYFDTPERSMAQRRASVRLRTYVEPAGELFFEVVWLRWDRDRDGAQDSLMRPRVNDVVVQSFAGNGRSDCERHAREYVIRGLVQVAKVRKVRHKFELAPIQFSQVDAREHAGFRNLVHRESPFHRCDDMGLRVLVDEMDEAVRGFDRIVEIEFGTRHRTAATHLMERFRLDLADELRPKPRNKIRDLLDESDGVP